MVIYSEAHYQRALKEGKLFPLNQNQFQNTSKRNQSPPPYVTLCSEQDFWRFPDAELSSVLWHGYCGVPSI
ncbi:MAG: hypothetical protein LLF83_10600 [Methanobacterium sp.]|nr:hypothetical protein [Methanobacterium sp.]